MTVKRNPDSTSPAPAESQPAKRISAIDLKRAPSGMEQMAEQWRRKAKGE